MKKTIGIVQPTYLPWLPFFERWSHSNSFILLDDVQYSKNSFFNRNCIKTANGITNLTIPILYKNHSKTYINQIKLNPTERWRAKHWKTIQMAYGKAPFWGKYKDFLQDYYQKEKGDRLINWLLPMIIFLGRELQMPVEVSCSSSLGVKSTQNQKLIDLCHSQKGTHFIVKPGTEKYHPAELFQTEKIDFAYLSYSSFVYPQLYGEYSDNLSALDYLLNCGPKKPNFSSSLEL